MSSNLINDVQSLEELKLLPSLTSLDISQNSIDQTEGILEYFKELEELVILNVKVRSKYFYDL